MIIECPACATRYDIDLPPEGRSVRCAKCGTVWRAMPERTAEELEADDDFWTAPAGESGDTSHKAPAIEESHDPFAAVDGAGTHGVLSNRDGIDPGERSLDGHEPGFRTKIDKPDEGAGAGEDNASSQGDGSGKIRWFLSFRRRKKLQEAEETGEGLAEMQNQPAAEPIPFPRPNVAVEQAAAEMHGEQHTLEAARQAFQGVFSGIGHRGKVASSAISAGDIPSTQPEDASSDAHNSWTKRWAEFSDRFKKDASPEQSSFDAALNPGADPQSERPFHTMAKNVLRTEGKEIDDPDAALREAMRAHFHPRPERKTAASSLDSAASSLDSEDLARKLETHLKSRSPAPDATVEAEDEEPGGRPDLWRKEFPKAYQDRFPDENRFEPEPALASEGPAAEAGDDDIAFDQGLYREIEETQEKSGHPVRRSGGLALAAAWGLFLCVASGLTGGFFAFRDTIADAVPGLAPLYRDLGMPVTAQPLFFEQVQYEWSMPDNRPVLTVSGSVFNRAHHSVKVPQFFITVKDQDPQLDQEYSASLNVKGSKIGSNERAEFAIELVSPNAGITAVELDLRNVR